MSEVGGRKSEIQPLFLFEEKQHGNSDQPTKAPKIDISKAPVELGHIHGQLDIEIHSIHASQKCERYENHGNNGKHTHDLVRAETQARNIQIH